MSALFYVSSVIAVIATFMALIICKQAIHALLYLIVSLLALGIILFDIGAHFAGALEIIVYAGAIMVLFVFVVMLINPIKNITRRSLVLPASLSIALLATLLTTVVSSGMAGVTTWTPSFAAMTKIVTIQLFQRYGTLVELASFLLLAGLIAAYHIARTGKNERN